MDVIIVLVFFSLSLVIAGLIFFFTRLRDGDFDHEERLSILPPWPMMTDRARLQDEEVDPGMGIAGGPIGFQCCRG